mmetsp:Transcript_10160/g.16809  ORF Transcript_10160/g.16809 Transcript_10160/m.16809 type:complete len:638 (+) Transcript_10160:95-2008(+)
MSAFDSDGTPEQIAALFDNDEGGSSDRAWGMFTALQDWAQRESVVQQLHAYGGKAFANYASHYRAAMTGIISDDFYDEAAEEWAAEYAAKGEISVPLLAPGALPALAAYAASVENLGKHRYAQTRPCYPPGEVALKFSSGDPRKQLFTEVNLTAVGSGQMTSPAARALNPDSGRRPVDETPVHWIYHSPQLREFLRVVMGSRSLHPYLSDLGVAVNVMRPPSLFTADEHTSSPNKTALGFHFDSIDSSSRRRSSDSSPHQPRGATGVIGIQDCEEGGERVVFPTIHRAEVEAVRSVVENFNPLKPHATVGEHCPVVFTEATARTLYLFDGGDVLHAVSGVRRGSRIAAVFLFQEDHAPEASADGDASAKYFYDDKVQTQTESHRSPQPQPQPDDSNPQSMEMYVHGKYDAVYEQSSAALYDKWATDPVHGYDNTVASVSVAVRSVQKVLVSAVNEMSRRGAGAAALVLDAGCGTGRVAEVCRECQEESPCAGLQGTSYDGIDYSRGMLSVCLQKKGLYRRLVQADLTRPLPNSPPAAVMGSQATHQFRDGMYCGVVSSGTFLQGHLGPEALPELCRVTRPGGFLVFSVRPTFFEERREDWLTTLRASGMVDVVVTMSPYDAAGLLAPVVCCFKATPA